MLDVEQFRNKFKNELNDVKNEKRGISDDDLAQYLGLKYCGQKLLRIAEIINEDYGTKFTKSTLSKFFKKT